MDHQAKGVFVDMKKRIGIYPGSFDPFHIGHLDICRQAKNLFDEIFVVRAINPDKSESKSKMPVSFLNDSGFKVTSHEGLITDMVKLLELQGNDVTLIRGLRSGADLTYEQNLVAFMKNMHPILRVVFFLCDPKYQHISSSTVRGLRKFSEEEYRKYALEG